MPGQSVRGPKGKTTPRVKVGGFEVSVLPDGPIKPGQSVRSPKGEKTPRVKPGDFEFEEALAAARLIDVLPGSPFQQLAGTWAASNLPFHDVGRILRVATEAFDDLNKGLRWLKEPNIRTGNKPPISLIGTPEGFQAVETVLRQIQYGVYA